MTIANLGRVLAAMATYGRERVELRRGYLGDRNAELLYAISHMLGIGAETCLKIVEEEDPK